MENKNSKLIILVLVLILIIGAVAVIINARLTKQLGQTLKQSAELPQRTAQPTSEVLKGKLKISLSLSLKA